MIGTVVGNYKIVEKLGEGGMGTVFKGVELLLEREVAIKTLLPELARQPQLVERFRAEAAALAKLNHPHIATLYNFFRADDSFYMVMEFVRGQPFDKIIANQGALGYEKAIPLFCQALEGIEHAHRFGIVHRDIKPANIMLTDDGTVKVMDFGIARVLGANRMTRTGLIIGTLAYMSPEQVNSQEIDARSDIYSLGILLYEMLTGRVPFQANSEYEIMKAHVEAIPLPPRHIVPNVPIPIEQAVLRALAKNPLDRFQTAGEFRAFLLDSLRTSPTAVLPPDGSNIYEAPTQHINTAAPNSEVTTKRFGPSNAAPPAINILDPQVKATTPVVGAGQLAPQWPVTIPNPPSRPTEEATASRSVWKYYIVAAAVLILMGATIVSVMLISSGKPDPVPPVVQPASNPVLPATPIKTNPIVDNTKDRIETPSKSNNEETKKIEDILSGSPDNIDKTKPRRVIDAAAKARAAARKRLRERTERALDQ
ncbi:MAG: serine/threonine-protein kinase [Acidobacteriota bacterium]